MKDQMFFQAYAGMTVDVNILTRKEYILDYILKPIIKVWARALKEQ